MDLNAKDLFTLCAMVQRLQEEMNAQTASLNALTELLVANGTLAESDKQKLNDVIKLQIDIARKTEIAQNEPEVPVTQRLPDELTEELESLGVLSQPKSLAESLTTNFNDLVERAFQEFRREQRHGEGGGGTVAEV